MAMLADAIVGAVVGELLRAVLKMKDKAVKFRPTLERLESTLNSIEPRINEIEIFNRQLDRPKEETESLIKQMKKGKDLVLECSKVRWWKCCYRANYQDELQALDESIIRFFQLDMQGHIWRDGAETLVELKMFRTDLRKLNLGTRNDRMELGGVCSPPEPREFIVGLDVPMRELKLKLLQDQVDVSVVNVTGSGGSGKTTFAKMICWDDQVRGKFKKNIFFVTFAKTPKLNSIVQKLFQHTGYQVPELESDEDAVNQLEHLLKQIGESPILLVLDDVWPGSESLIDNFLFQITGYKILVTSRFTIGRFGPPYVLKPLGEQDAIKLFHHSASLPQISSDVPDDVVKEIVRRCSGSPLALRVVGRSLSHQNPVIWHNRARELSWGRSILDSSNDVLVCLQKSFDALDPKVIECFRDLCLFPEDQRIPASALVDMWAELHGYDDESAMEKIYQLVNLNMADIIVTRKVASYIDNHYYNNHFIVMHDLLRELAIHESNKEIMEQRKRLIIGINESKCELWLGEQQQGIVTGLFSKFLRLFAKQKPLKVNAQTLSLSIDDTCSSYWANMQPAEAEVLILNLHTKQYSFPEIMNQMSKLKVLIVTNYGFHPFELDNFNLLGSLSNLKRIRLERISVPSFIALKNIKKLSLYMCNMSQAFESNTIPISDALPNLVELSIDYCKDIVELPIGVCDITPLVKLSITNCHKLSSLPKEIGNLENLELLRLSSCTDLEGMPDSIGRLSNLRLLDISNCISLPSLPEDIGNLSNLRNLYMTNCTRCELPYSVIHFENLKVICDEETAVSWEALNPNIKIEIPQVDVNLNWLHAI